MVVVFFAPRRRTAPLPPHRRQTPQRLLLVVFFLLPPHDGQRRIGCRCTSSHQAAMAMATAITTNPAALTASLP
jgi:hypothetical protein